MNPDSLTTDDEAEDDSRNRGALSRWGVVDKNVTFFRDEQEMILKFVQLVKVKDIILSLESRKHYQKMIILFTHRNFLNEHFHLIFCLCFKCVIS